ncbi:putative bifunctional diguanylate cyclase/phosphodiesterase [Ancylobacter lacus]|uniref:putative bifunctional diguanylate cyclase/phosphodiesterase n=1 Tax=Ancylobacter lacus TaxID=2579970 RepID=UPI001BCCD2EB|nr:EAL domain-containing protein [Ancylobacter lacus]MBS7539500.1 EAL domain-containing protein [Ancylobacter lacus]
MAGGTQAKTDIPTEEARLEALQAFNVAGVEGSSTLEEITRLAADIFGMPRAWVSFVERDRQWLVSRTGVDIKETPRSSSFCSHTVQGDVPLVVPDIDRDPRFRDMEQIGTRLRFYAGAPLISAHGHRIGALCVGDTAPRGDFTEADAGILVRLAALVMEHLELLRSEIVRQSMMAFGNATDLAMIATNAKGIILFVNRAASHIFGYGPDEMIGRDCVMIMPERMREAHSAAMARVSAGGQSRLSGRTLEVTGLRRDRTEFPMELSLSVWRRHDGEVGMGAIIRDISLRRQRDMRLLRLANHDPLTGLKNRRRFEDLLGAFMERSGNPAVLLLDLDGFKEVNDTQGHGVGDTVLQAVAVRIAAALPSDAVVARFGGDEFAVLLPDSGGPDFTVATLAAQAVLRAFVSPFVTEGLVFQLGVSIGCACAPEHASDVEELIASADFALYRAKEGGGRNWRLFEPAMRDAARAQRALQDELLRGLHRGEFELYYQPQVALDRGRIFGMEALIRWNHPRRGVLTPAAFVEVLAGSVLALPVGRWVMNEACARLEAWRAAGIGDVRVGINIFPAQFRGGTFGAEVLEAIRRHHLDPGSVEIEVTEGVMLDYDEVAMAQITMLRHAGVRVALDDFGTGYASLSALKRFPLTTLKIDRSFVTDLATSPRDTAIARAMLSMGAELGLDVIAEGVETPEQERMLIELGCVCGQGFRYGRPMAESEALGALQRDAERQQAGAAL